jgi:hypothetical protein
MMGWLMEARMEGMWIETPTINEKKSNKPHPLAFWRQAAEEELK